MWSTEAAPPFVLSYADSTDNKGFTDAPILKILSTEKIPKHKGLAKNQINNSHDRVPLHLSRFSAQRSGHFLKLLSLDASVVEGRQYRA